MSKKKAVRENVASPLGSSVMLTASQCTSTGTLEVVPVSDETRAKVAEILAANGHRQYPPFGEHSSHEIGPGDIVHLIRFPGEGWRVSQIESFRGSIANARHGSVFGQELGIFDRIFPAQTDACEFARTILDARPPR